MIDTLAIVLPHFPGAVNCARCLAHIINLVSKIILHQFDAIAKKNKNYRTRKDKTVSALNEIEGLDDLTDLKNGLDQRNMDEEDDEENESLMDEIKEIERVMSDEIDEVVKQAKPVQCVLFKVCYTHQLQILLSVWSLLMLLFLSHQQLQKFSYAVKNSTTILLPKWKDIIAQLASDPTWKKLSICMMPHNISTCWNSTYEMLKFAYTYRPAIDKLTGDCDMKLWDYELLESECGIVKQLWDCLKVCKLYYLYFNCLVPFF